VEYPPSAITPSLPERGRGRPSFGFHPPSTTWLVRNFIRFTSNERAVRRMAGIMDDPCWWLSQLPGSSHSVMDIPQHGDRPPHPVGSSALRAQLRTCSSYTFRKGI
jgi:hypothetical protein